MIQGLIGPIANLAGTWLNGKVETKAAETKAKVAKAEAEAQIMLSRATSEADWEKIKLMALLLWRLCLSGIVTHLE
jgi:hypothetical protein